jgi:hypothetical protein
LASKLVVVSAQLTDALTGQFPAAARAGVLDPDPV